MQLIRKVSKRLTPAGILLLGLLMLFPISSYSAPKDKFVVVIDAGHGGKDPGAEENHVKEKDVNLGVALKLGQLIKKNLKDTEVIYTREDDKFVSLQGRADIANKAQADLFISIHCNSVDRNNPNRETVQGATTYVLGHNKDAANLEVARRENEVAELDENDKIRFSKFDQNQDESVIITEIVQKQNHRNSVIFARDVQNWMQNIGRQSRGVKEAGFWVLWSTAMPSALIELDFICNPTVAKFLGSNEGQEKLAKSIYEAVRKYEEYYSKNLGRDKVSKESKEKTEKAAKDKKTAKESEKKEVTKVVEESSAASTGNAGLNGNSRRRHKASPAAEPVSEPAPSATTVETTSEQQASPSEEKGGERKAVTKRRSRR